ncbi:hypothetical protein F5X99DRAFT_133938 [Biscogniauxia marginata]|nr:hypothetical protein F5X99DRAFT_133938 [Biscogniauxia marginata]
MWTCGTCGREFATCKSRQQHMDALCHSMPPHECDTCERYFGSRRVVENHMNALGHWNYECDFCYEKFSVVEELNEHEIEDHYYCSDCDRTFMNYNNVKMHLNSRIHRGTNMQCPFCKAGYATATGLTHHLESGACPNASSLNRDELYKAIRRKDPNGLISKNLIGWNGSPVYEASPNAWNGFAWECYFCHRQYNTRESLNQHLGSPAHHQKLYHCPNRGICSREFTSFAALMNHLESESCGYTRFEDVQRSAKDIISGDRRIAFR